MRIYRCSDVFYRQRRLRESRLQNPKCDIHFLTISRIAAFGILDFKKKRKQIRNPLQKNISYLALLRCCSTSQWNTTFVTVVHDSFCSLMANVSIVADALSPLNPGQLHLSSLTFRNLTQLDTFNRYLNILQDDFFTSAFKGTKHTHTNMPELSSVFIANVQ